jgi:hypothetical protein
MMVSIKKFLFLFLSDDSTAMNTVTYLGEVVYELNSSRDGTSGNGILGDLVSLAVASSGDDCATYNSSNQSIFLREYRKRKHEIG